MLKRNAVFGAVLGTALVLGACGPTTSAHMGEGNAFAAEERSTIVVENDHWADVALYMVRSGVKMRVGTIRSMQTQRINVDAAMLGPGGTVVFIADPIGSRFGFRSDPIVFTPGSTAEVRLGSNLRFSNVIVW